MTDNEYYEWHDKLLEEVYLPIASTYRFIMNPKMALAEKYYGDDEFKVPLQISKIDGTISYLLVGEKMFPSIKTRFENIKKVPPQESSPTYNKDCLDALVYLLAEFMFYHMEVLRMDTFKFINYDSSTAPEGVLPDSLYCELALFSSVTGSYTSRLAHMRAIGKVPNINIAGMCVYLTNKQSYQFNDVEGNIPEDFVGPTGLNPKDYPTQEDLYSACYKYYLIGWMCRMVFTRHCSIRFLFNGD